MKTRSNAGFALIDLLFVCGIIGVISAIAVPRLVMAKQSAGAASAIGSLRAINSAQLTFALTCGGGFYSPDLPTLGKPPVGSQAPFLSKDLTGAATLSKSGYTMNMSAAPHGGTPQSCNGLAAGATGTGFKAGADAIDPTNFRFFATNSSGHLYEHTASLYAGIPEPGAPPVGHLLQ